MKRDNLETIIWLFCILVIIALIGKIEFESRGYSCSKCSVFFTNTLVGGESYEFGEYSTKELFENYVKTGKCSIKWDPTQGYYNG